MIKNLILYATILGFSFILNGCNGSSSDISSPKDTQALTLLETHISSNKIGDTKDIFLDSSGNLWFASGGWSVSGNRGRGVSKYNTTDDTWQTYTTDDGLAGNSVYAIAQDGDYMYFGTIDGGVSKYNTIDNTWQTYTKENTTNGLISNAVYTIVKDKDGHLWFGTNGGGVSKYNTMDKSWTSYTSANTYDEVNETKGLVNDTVKAIAQDNDGNMWFGTNGGVSKYNIKNNPYLSQKVCLRV